jgi:uncharacterized protein (UPF0335 family)
VLELQSLVKTVESYDNPAKNAARERLYGYFLPSVFSIPEIKASKFLILPGAECLELPIIKNLGVPASNVYGVENDNSLHLAIKEARDRLGYKFRFQSTNDEAIGVAEFLEDHLGTDFNFSVLNLDIEGQFSHNLYPAFTEVLLYCYRRPQTVVATYYSSGRGRADINQGLISLGFLLSLGMDEIYETLQLRFRQGVGSEKTGYNQTLRMLYWWRAHLDHIIRSEVILGNLNARVAGQYFAYLRSIWELIKSCKGNEITLGEMKNLKYSKLPKLPPLKLGVNFGKLEMLYYHGLGTYLQNCFYATYDHLETPQNLRDWLNESAARIKLSRTICINKSGELIDTFEPNEIVPDELPLPTSTVVWQDAPHRSDLATFQPRFKSETPIYNPAIAAEVGDSVDKPTRLLDVQDQAEAKQSRVIEVVIDNFSDHKDQIISLHNQGFTAIEIVEKLALDASVLRSVIAIKAHATRRNRKAKEAPKVNDEQREKVKKLAANGYDSAAIKSQLKLSKKDLGSVRAIMAHVTRNADPEDLLIRQLAAEGHSADEIIEITGTSLPKAKIAAKIGVVRRLANLGVAV